MDILENIKLSLEGLRTNKMRSLLTMLGIIIGIGAVIGIMTIGDAMTAYINKEFDSFGATAISFDVSSKDSDNVSSYQESDLISESMIEAIEARFENRITSTTLASAMIGGTVKEGKNSAPVTVLATTKGYMDVQGVKMESGRFLNEEDEEKNRNIAVISSEVVKEIFGGDNSLALGSEISIDTTDKGLLVFTVVGVYKHETSAMMSMASGGANSKPTTYVYIPLTTGERISPAEMEGYDQIVLMGKEKSDIENLRVDVETYLNETYYAENDYFEISSYSVESQIASINAVLNVVQLAIGAIAGISLLVGGVGVMNILLVSVTERTSEIGVRKAMGATNNNIRMQFIVESIILCILGGIIGIILGGAIGYIASSLVGATTLPSSTAIIVAVGFSTFIGVFFGYYPANKAAQLNPIEALRYE